MKISPNNVEEPKEEKKRCKWGETWLWGYGVGAGLGGGLVMYQKLGGGSLMDLIFSVVVVMVVVLLIMGLVIHQIDA